MDLFVVMVFQYVSSQYMLIWISLIALGTSQQLQEIGYSSIAKGSQLYQKDLTCPTWFIPVLHANNITFCECNDHQIESGAVIKCPRKRKIRLDHMEEYGKDELNVSILIEYCMTFNLTTKQIILGTCPYYDFKNEETSQFDFYVIVPSNVADLNDYMCQFIRREGELCNRCINGTGLGSSITRLSGKCFYCDHHNMHAAIWTGFIAWELLQSTLVFAIILLCSVPANTGPLNAFLFLSQILSVFVMTNKRATKWWIHLASRNAGGNGISKLIEAFQSFYVFWFDFNVLDIHSCISENISAVQMVALQYLSPLYILFLIIVVSVCTNLHYMGCRLLNCLCRPFPVCMRRLAMNWDPLSSIVNTIATFIVLVYTKVLYISFTLITPWKIYNQSGELPFKVMPFNSSIHFLSQEHLPYFCLALTMLTLFCVLPLIILFILPMKCFAQLLNRKPLSNLNWIPLHTFADAFTGCYKNRTGPQKRECRYFASLYLFFRFAYISLLFSVSYSHIWPTLVSLSILMFLLFAVVQPYRKKWLNTVDSTALFLLTVGTILIFYSAQVASIPVWLLGVLLIIPFFYFVAIIAYKIVVRRCILKCQSGHTYKASK